MQQDEHTIQQRAPSTQVTPSTQYSSCNNLCSKTLWWAHQPPKYGRARIREAVDVQLLISRFHPKVFDHWSLPDLTTATWSPIITYFNFSQQVSNLFGKGEKQSANIKKQLTSSPGEDGAYGVCVGQKRAVPHYSPRFLYSLHFLYSPLQFLTHLSEF